MVEKYKRGIIEAWFKQPDVIKLIKIVYPVNNPISILANHCCHL